MNCVWITFTEFTSKMFPNKIQTVFGAHLKHLIKMADNENDVLIDGKSLFSLRVIDLKRELKKRGVKPNGSKAQLQNLLIYHLNKSDDKTDKSESIKQSDDEISQQITEPSDSSPGNEGTNTLSVDDEDSHQRSHSNDLNEPNDEPTDLTKESAITSSVSINEEKNSIKLTIKLQPNDQTCKQMSPKKEIKVLDLSPEKETQSLDLSPKKEIKPRDSSPEKISKTLDLSPKKEIKPRDSSPEKTSKSLDLSPKKEIKPRDSSPEKASKSLDLNPKKEIKPRDSSPEKTSKSLDLNPKKVIKPRDSSPEKISKSLDLSPKKEVKTKELSSRKERREPKHSLPTNREIEISKEETIDEIREQTPEPKDLSVEKENNENAMDLSSTEVKKSVEEKSEKIVESSDLSAEKEVVIESINDKEKSSVTVEEGKEIETQSSIELNEPIVETGTVSSSDTVITETLPVIEEEVKLNSQSSDKLKEPNTGPPDSSLEKVIETNNKSEPKVEKVKPPRKRRWGSTAANDSQQITHKGISSDQLKELLPDINYLNSTFSSAMTSYTTTIATTVTSKVSKSGTSILSTNSMRPQSSPSISEIPSKRDIRVVRKQVSIPEEDSAAVVDEEPESVIPKVDPKKIVAKIEELNKNEDNSTKREVSPARNTETNIVFIRNLVRPFTLLQLKEVLGKTGKLIEQQFWIDKIKSKCFATYDTVNEAIETRKALHGMRWPASNPKLLFVDFATKEELDSHLNSEVVTNKEDVNNNNNNDNNNKINENVNEKYDIIIKTDTDKNVFREKIENNDSLRNKTENRPIREWDREKLIKKEEVDKSRTPAKRRPRSPSPRSRSRERTDKSRRRHDSTKGGERVRASDQLPGEAPKAGTTQDIESPAKLLDDLFKKTTATPSIYWLPLTEEQVVSRDALKAELDKKRTEERNAREEQFRKRQEGFQNYRRGMDNKPQLRNERGQWRPNSPNRRNFGPRRMSPNRRSPVRRFEHRIH